jgi:hypothetical protein
VPAVKIKVFGAFVVINKAASAFNYIDWIDRVNVE